jgi:hypothetical protein
MNPCADIPMDEGMEQIVCAVCVDGKMHCMTLWEHLDFQQLVTALRFPSELVGWED